MADSFTSQRYSLKKQTRWSNDKTIIELGYQIIDLLATDKSQYFAKPRPIIVVSCESLKVVSCGGKLYKVTCVIIQ